MNQIVKPPLDGELLGPSDALIVQAHLHPLKIGFEPILMPLGLTVEEIVAACERFVQSPGLADSAMVEINGHPVPPRMWKHVRINKQCHVSVRILPKGFLVAPLLGALFPSLVGTTAFGILTNIVVAGVGLLANLIMSSLFAPSQQEAEKNDPVYSISGTRNEVEKWGPIPSVLGQQRFAPKYASSPVTEFDGDDQYVRMLFVWGYGPLTVSDIRLGETPIADFDDVEIETNLGYADDPKITLYTGQPVQEDLSLVPKQNVPVSRDTAEDAIQIGIDLVAPNGIFRTDSKGKLKSYSVSLRIEYKLASAPDSAYQVFTTAVFEGDGQQPIRKTYRIKNLAPNQYSVRITRLSQDPDQEPNKGVNVQWTALRIFRDAKTYDFDKPLAMTALRIRATDQLNGAPDDLNAIVTSRARVYVGGSWVADTKASPRPTTWPFDLFRHVLQGPANKRPVPDSQIDLASIQAWSVRCRAKGFRFNMVRDFRASVWDTLRDICAVGRAVPLFKDGKWSVAWEDPTAPIVQHFTPFNSWNFKGSINYFEQPHALRVKFLNAKKGWIEDERLVYADGYSKANATLIETFELPGVTDPDLIYKHGRYRLAELKLRPGTNTLSADWENLVATRGDRVKVSHDELMNTLQTGRVVATSGQTVTLSQPVLMQVGQTYAIEFRAANGSSLLRSVVNNPGQQSTITLQGSGTMPAEPVNGSYGDLFAFGPSTQVSSVFRVKRISPSADFSAELELVDDAPEIEASDDGTIPDYDSGLILPPDLRQFPPFNLRIVETTELRGSAAVFVATLLFDEVAGVNADSFIVVARNQFGQTARVTTTVEEARFENFTPGMWTFTVQSVYGKRVTVPSAPLMVAIRGENAVPPDVNEFSISPIADVANLTWADPISPIDYTEIRYTPATSGATWASAIPLVAKAKGTSVQVPFQTGTYLAKHVSYGGVPSAAAALVVVTNAGIINRNVVYDYFEMSPFDGTHTRTVDAPLGLELASMFNVFGPADIFAVDDVFLGDTGLYADGYYQPPETIDLGEVFTSRVSADLTVQGVNLADNIFAYPDVFSLENVFGVDPDQWSVQAEIRTKATADLSGPWSDWTGLVVGDYTARAFQFRLYLAAADFGVTPRVMLFHVSIDMPDRVEGGRDLVVPVTGLRVNFIPPFRALTGLSRSDQDMQTGDRAIITNQGPTGFDILYRNSGGTAIQRTFDYVAKGYGRKV